MIPGVRTRPEREMSSALTRDERDLLFEIARTLLEGNAGPRADLRDAVARVFGPDVFDERASA